MWEGAESEPHREKWLISMNAPVLAWTSSDEEILASEGFFTLVTSALTHL